MRKPGRLLRYSWLGARRAARWCIAKVEPACLAALGMWLGLSIGGSGLAQLGCAVALGAFGCTVAELLPIQGRTLSEQRLARFQRRMVPAAFCIGLVLAGAVTRYRSHIAQVPSSIVLQRAGVSRALTLAAVEGMLAADSQTTARRYRSLQLDVACLEYGSGPLAVRIEPIARAPSKSSLARPGARLWAGSSVRLEGLQSDGGGRNEVIFAERIELLNGNQPGLAAWFARVRTSLAAGFSYAVSRAAGRAGPLANALLLGVKDDIDSEYRDLFRAAGCSHLLALSGQHLSIICALAAFVWKRLFRREGMVRRIALCFAWFFVWLAGPGPSLRRAAFMMSVNEIARTLDRPQRGIVALSLASLALALVSPPDLMSLSSIFSYSSMAGLIVLAPRAASMLRRWLPPFLAESLAASCAALCATAPVSMINFGMFSVAGILAAPVSGAVMLAFMWTALTAGVVAVFLPRISFVSAPILELLEKVLLAVLDIGSRIAPVQAASRDTQFLWLMIIAAFAALLYAGPVYSSRMAALRYRAERTRAEEAFRARKALLRMWIDE